MSLMQHYNEVITRMQLDICRLIEEKTEPENRDRDTGWSASFRGGLHLGGPGGGEA